MRPVCCRHSVPCASIRSLLPRCIDGSTTTAEPHQERQLLLADPSPHFQSRNCLPSHCLKPGGERKATRVKNSPVFFHRRNLGRLHCVLDRHDRSETTRPSQRQQIDIIRLLLLTGCRKNEIIRLRKQEVAENCLRLLDSKTGPRTVFLNAEARAIVERRMNGSSEFVFPSPQNSRASAQ